MPHAERLLGLARHLCAAGRAKAHNCQRATRGFDSQFRARLTWATLSDKLERPVKGSESRASNRSALRVARWFSTGLFVLAVPLFLISANLRYVVNAPARYREGFEKYDIPAATGISLDQLMIGAHGLIDYFNSDEPDLHVVVQKSGEPFVLFNEREVLHMRDVKSLIQFFFRLNTTAFIYLLFYVAIMIGVFGRRFGRPLAWAILGGASLTLALLVAVGIGAAIDFDGLFLKFHLISFSNNFWQLDPRTDYLIRMYPEEFFYDATVFLALSSVIEAMVLAAFSASFLLFWRRPVRASAVNATAG